MDKILETPPEAVRRNLLDLRDDLDARIPFKQLDRNLLLATWNIRAFGDLTEKWESSEQDSPKRDLHSLLCISEILSRFDVIAIQEVRSNLKCLRHALKVLGPHWSMALTDVTKGSDGNNERIAFLFDTRRAKMSGLACELVVPEEWLKRVGKDTLKRQFARTPYAVSFYSAGRTFILVTLHVLYGKSSSARVPELKAIASWLADWARDVNAYDHNIIALGDFNIDRRGSPLYDAFTSTGLQVPADLINLPRTLFSDPGAADTDQFYDQIAWFAGNNGIPALSLRYLAGGNYDFSHIALSSRGLTQKQLSWRISDHYPLWTEFSVTP